MNDYVTNITMKHESKIKQLHGDPTRPFDHLTAECVGYYDSSPLACNQTITCFKYERVYHTRARFEASNKRISLFRGAQQLGRTCLHVTTPSSEVYRDDMYASANGEP